MCLHKATLKLHMHTCIFFLSVNSVSWWKAAFEWGGVYCSPRSFIVRKMTERLEQKTRLLWFARLLTLLISGYIAEKFWIKCAAPVVPSFSLQWKSVESTKHHLTQMLLSINWRYWQAENHVFVWRWNVASSKSTSLSFSKRSSDTFLTK